MFAKYKTGALEGEKMMWEVAEKIKREGKDKPYDSMFGVSGGSDSLYVAYILTDMYVGLALGQAVEASQHNCTRVGLYYLRNVEFGPVTIEEKIFVPLWLPSTSLRYLSFLYGVFISMFNDFVPRFFA
jgi:hypothetical protein